MARADPRSAGSAAVVTTAKADPAMADTQAMKATASTPLDAATLRRTLLKWTSGLTLPAAS